MVDSQAGPELFSLFRDDQATITILTAGAVALFLRLENQNTNLGKQIKEVEKDLKVQIKDQNTDLGKQIKEVEKDIKKVTASCLVLPAVLSASSSAASSSGGYDFNADDGCQGHDFGAGALGARTDCGGDAPDASVAITHEQGCRFYNALSLTSKAVIRQRVVLGLVARRRLPT
jgi:hypothetical protein